MRAILHFDSWAFEEVLTLDWRHLDLASGTLRVVEGKTDRARRSIPLPAKTVAALEELPHREGLVFPSAKGTPFDPRNISRRWHAICEQAGTRRFRIHDLRHASGSLALAAGVDIVTVSRRLGHASVAFTADVYAHVLGSLAGGRPSRPEPSAGRACSRPPTDQSHLRCPDRSTASASA